MAEGAALPPFGIEEEEAPERGRLTPAAHPVFRTAVFRTGPGGQTAARYGRLEADDAEGDTSVPAQPIEEPAPQPVVSPLTVAAVFLVLTISPGGEDAVRDLIPDLSGLGRSVGFRIPEASLQVVTAIGSDAWDRLFAGPRPRELHPFRELTGARHTAPATPGDLLFHIRASRMDLCFEFAAQVMKRLAGAVEVADEIQGFRYFDERDLIGFVDGTESPSGAAGISAAILGADDDPDFAGGSYVIVQKYLHDMAAWNAISVEEQERVIGRSKLDDIEMPDDVQAGELARRTQHDHRAGRRAAADRAGEHAVRQPRAGRVRHVLHRVRRHARGDRGDAVEHVHRQPARQHRPDTRLLDRAHRVPVLRPARGLPRRPAGAARRGQASPRRPTLPLRRVPPRRRATVRSASGRSRVSRISPHSRHPAPGH